LQNTVVRLKPKDLSPPKLWASYATACRLHMTP